MEVINPSKRTKECSKILNFPLTTKFDNVLKDLCME